MHKHFDHILQKNPSDAWDSPSTVQLGIVLWESTKGLPSLSVFKDDSNLWKWGCIVNYTYFVCVQIWNYMQFLSDCVLIYNTQIELSAFNLQSFLNSHLKNIKALYLATFEPAMLLWWFRFSFETAERRSYSRKRKIRLSIFPVSLHSTHIFVSVLVVIHITNAFVHFSLSATIAQVIN